jgi:hypothetical protein
MTALRPKEAVALNTPIAAVIIIAFTPFARKWL